MEKTNYALVSELYANSKHGLFANEIWLKDVGCLRSDG